MNESDFYISKDDLSNGVFFVPNVFITSIQPMLQLEEGSQVSFKDDNSGVIISRRMLTLIEEKTNHTYEIGSNITFSIATQFLPNFVEALWGLQPFSFENLTINGIYDRLPIQNTFGFEFHQETLGDGIFVSHDLLPEGVIISMENQGFFPIFFVRVDRNEIARLQPGQVVPQIEYLASRIKIQGRLNVDVQASEIHSVLINFDQSRIVLLLLLLPFLILTEIFYLTLVPHLLNNRIVELYYLRLRGTSDRKIFIFLGTEFALLTIIGATFGFLGGTVFLDVLLGVKEFLGFNNFKFGSGLSLLIETGSKNWFFGVITIVLLNYVYAIARFRNIIRQLQQYEGASPTIRMLTSVSIRKSSLIILVAGYGIFLLFTIIGPIILGQFGTSGMSPQLAPLICIFLITLWLLYSFYAPQFCLQIIQSFFESLKIFSNPRKRITWLHLFRRKAQYLTFLALLTLTISLLSFTLIYIKSIQDNHYKNAIYVNGGDLKIITVSVNVANFTSRVNSIEGVNLCLGFPQLDVTIGDYSFRLIGVNPGDYYEISSLYPLSVIEGPPANRLWHSLSEEWDRAIIMNRFLADTFKWKVGDTVSALGILPGYNARFDFSITAIINSAPGIGPLYMGGISKGTYTFGGFAFVHEDFLTSFGNDEANTFLVRLSSSDRLSSVTNQLREINSVRMIFTPILELQYQQNFLELAGVQGILTLDFLGAIFISLIGITVFYQYLITEQLSEFAVFQAFGATKRRISLMAFKQSLFLIILGLILGIINGYLFALGFLISSRSITEGPYNIFLLELTFSLPELAAALTIVTAAIIIVVAFPLRRIHNMELTTILRGE